MALINATGVIATSGMARIFVRIVTADQASTIIQDGKNCNPIGNRGGPVLFIMSAIMTHRHGDPKRALAPTLAAAR